MTPRKIGVACVMVVAGLTLLWALNALAHMSAWLFWPLP